MTPKEKLQMIEDKIKSLNDNVLKYKKWKIAYANKGSNNYCLTIVLNKKELFCGKFNTYGSVLSSLELMEFMFSRALDELDKSSVKNKKNKKEEK